LDEKIRRIAVELRAKPEIEISYVKEEELLGATCVPLIYGITLAPSVMLI
jgi:hypothetical protein